LKEFESNIYQSLGIISQDVIDFFTFLIDILVKLLIDLCKKNIS